MKKNYLSKEGNERLEKELRDLKTNRQKEIADKQSEARSKRDLSENTEYDAAKEAQEHIEKKNNELEHTLTTATINDEKNMEASKSYVLSTLTSLNKKTGK